MNKQGFGDAGWSMSIPCVALWRCRVLCDVVSPQKKENATIWWCVLLNQSTGARARSYTPMLFCTRHARSKKLLDQVACVTCARMACGPLHWGLWCTEELNLRVLTASKVVRLIGLLLV